MDITRLRFIILITQLYFFKVSGQCFFPGELQGYWATQAAPDASDAPNEYNISYSMVKIEQDFISTWGHCHKKMDDNIILSDINRSRTNSLQCFRCFRLVVASFNVAALVSSGLESCFPTVQDALKSCPTTERGAAHIVLYKVRSSGGDSAIEESQCPLSGIFHFSYEKGFERRYSESCEQPTSEMSNCHLGYKFNLRFSECNFVEPRGGNWHCLGSWSGLDGQRYTTMLDMDAREGDGRPKYKCGIYKEEKGSGRVFLAFSRDSTCKNGLHDAHNGYERFVLHSANSAPLPRLVQEATCHFPKSLRGKWHNTIIRKKSIKFRDVNKFVTYQMHCVKDIGDARRYVVYTRTNCGKVEYRCIYLKRRAANILEFMFGESGSDSVVPYLCDERQFGNYSTWITQATRKDSEIPTRCPIVGTYRGELPDSPGYCAELYSDCDRPDTMYYAIDDCNNPSAVYERKRVASPVQTTQHSNPQTRRRTRPRKVYNQRVHTPAEYAGNVGIPREIKIGTIEVMPARYHRGPENSQNVRIGPTIQVLDDGNSHYRRGRSARQANPGYRINNPQTTTLSFLWGKSATANQPTTPLPFRRQPSFIQDRSGFQRGSGNLNTPATRNGFMEQLPNRNFRPTFEADSRSFSPRDHRPPGFGHAAADLQRGARVGGRADPFSGDSRGNSGVRGPLPNARGSLNPLGFWPSGGDRSSVGDVPVIGLEERRGLGGGTRDFSTTFDRTRPTIPAALPSFPVVGVGIPQPVASQIGSWIEIDADELKGATESNLRLIVGSEDDWSKKTLKKYNKEEREYQCLGQWKEDGNIFALTRRTDIHTYECFVGVSDAEGDGVVFIKEAGSSCSRGIKPKEMGMQTIMKEKCSSTPPRRNFTMQKPIREVHKPPRPLWVPSTSRPNRSWEPITGRPRRSGESSAVSIRPSITAIICLVVLLT